MTTLNYLFLSSEQKLQNSKQAASLAGFAADYKMKSWPILLNKNKIMWDLGIYLDLQKVLEKKKKLSLHWICKKEYCFVPLRTPIYLIVAGMIIDLDD